MSEVQFEYKVERYRTGERYQDWLNNLGHSGWKLVTVNDGWWIFIRPIMER